MLNEKLISLIADEVIRQLNRKGLGKVSEIEPRIGCMQGSEVGTVPDINWELEDITSPACKAKPLLKNPQDIDALLRMKRRTTARIGVGRAGPRLNTQTLLTLRADHAKARDSVFTDVAPELIEKLGLFTVETLCKDKDTFITRPDLGRKLSLEAEETIRKKCIMQPDVQIYAADGLSSSAIEKNLEKILPILLEGLKGKGLKVGTPFFLRFGRVASEDQVAEILGAKVVCVLIGERPGLATAESMSAYIVYNSYVGIEESCRTVVSNIHKNGLTAIEAGAYIVEVIEKILEQKASGVNLVK